MRFTERETEVVRLLARGASQKAVAAELGISRRTVEHHLQNAKREAGVSKTTELIFLFLSEEPEKAA